MSFGNIITFMQSLFAAQTIEPEIVGFSGVSLDQASNTLAVIGTIICELIYFLVKWILAVVDFLQYFIQKLIGLDYWLQPGSKTIEGATDNDLLFQFLYNDTVQNVFRAMVGVFLILLVVFVIFAIVKTEWKYATGDGKGGNSKMQIFRSSFKAFLLVLVFPLVLTLGIISSNAILASLVGALNLDMAQTFGGTLFSIAAEPANKFRIYSSTDQRAPVTQRITFYVENSTGKTILFSNGTTYPEDKYCTYYSNYNEYLSVIYGKVSGSPRCTEYTIDTIFDVVVPRKERNFSGYCAGLEVDGTTKYFLVKCTYAEKEGMYYYLRNILNAKVLSKNTTINSNQGMTGNTVTELRKDLKDHIESTGKQSFISGADLHDYGSGAVIDAAYNTWGYASVFQQLHTFEESQSFKVINTDVLSRYELSTSITNAKVSFNSNLVSPYFDGGQFGYVSKQAEYKVMADVIDFICNNNADLFMVDVTASTIEWNYGSYTDGIARYVGGGSDRKTKASAGSGLGDPADSNDVLPFIVQYSDLCSDADMGNQLYLANYNSSSEIEGAVYIMAWKVIKDGKTRYVPLINGRGYYNEATGQEFPTFKSEFYSNGYRGLVVAKGLLNNETTNQEYGEPTYITSGIDGVSGGVSGVEAPYYYNLTPNSEMYQYATAVASSKSADVSGAGRYDISNVMVANVDSTPSVGVSDKGGTYFKLINSDGSERDTSTGDVEGMTIHLKNRENLSSVTATYAGLEMGFEDSDNDTSKLNNNTKYLFVTGDGGYFVVSACKNASEYFVHEITYSTSTKKATVSDRDADARINVVSLNTTLKAHYKKGSTEDDVTIATVGLNMIEPTTAKVGGKAVYKTVDMQYLSISAITFAKSMYMNLTFDTAKTNLFSYDSDDDNKFMVAQPIAYAAANTAILQGTAFFDINYYDYTTGYIEDESKLYKFDLNSSSTTATAVPEPILVETFGVNSSEFNWANDSVSYNLYDGDRYVATIYKPAGTSCTFAEIPTKSSYMMIEYETFYNVRTMNTYDDKSAFEQESANLKSAVIVSFNRDSLGASSFIFDFRISLLGKGRLKLIMSTYEVERDARKGYFYTSDSMAFDYFFDGEGKVNGNKIELKTFYVPTKVSNPFGVGLWIMLISSALIIKILGTALWGIIKRFYEITLYYIAMPAVASTIVLDDGKRFQTSIQNPLIAKVLSTYGVILGINAFFVLLAPVRSMSNVFTAEDIATSGSYFLKALSNLPLFGSFELTAKLLNSYTYILFLLVAFTMINELPQLITRIMGTAKDGGDVVKSGADTKAQVKKTMNEAGNTLSGQGLMDGASEAIGMAKGMIPGSALVSAGAEKLGSLFKGGGGDSSNREDGEEEETDETTTENGQTTTGNGQTDGDGDDDDDGSNRTGDLDGLLDPENPDNPLGEVLEDGIGEVAGEILTEGGGEAVSTIAETVTEAVTGGDGSAVVAAATEAISENIPLNAEEAAEFIAANNEDIVQNDAAIAENNEFIAMAEQAITEEGTRTFASSDRIDELVASGELDASYVNTHEWGSGKKVKSIADGIVDENGVSLAEKFGIMTSSEVKKSMDNVEQSRADIEGFQAENATIQAQTDAKRKENEEIEAGLAKPTTEVTDATVTDTTATDTTTTDTTATDTTTTDETVEEETENAGLGVIVPGVTETGKKGAEVPAVVDNKQPEGSVDPAVATEAEKEARASLSGHQADLRHANADIIAARWAMLTAKDPMERTAAQLKLNEALEAKSKAKAAITKDKQDIENSMTPERKVARRNQITNTVMSVLGTAGTVVATIAGGPIAGILVHKAATHLKSAAPGVVNAISQQFGEFKKADGWGKASMIAGMAMKGSAVVAGGILAGQALAFAAPVLGAVGAATGALGVPLWAIGAAGLAGVASKKLNQLTSGNGQSYVNGGKSPVVRAGSGTDVPQVPAGTQTGGKPGTPAATGGKPAAGPVDPRLATEAEKAARASLKTHKAELSERTQERKEAQTALNGAQDILDTSNASMDELIEKEGTENIKTAKGNLDTAQAEYDAAVKKHGADSPEAQAAKTKLDEAQAEFDKVVDAEGTDDIKKQNAALNEAKAGRDEQKGVLEAAETAEKEAKEAVTKDKKDIEESMTPERKTARRTQITNTVMSVIGAVGTVAGTIAGGPIVGLLIHKTSKHLKAAAPGVVNAVSQQFGEFKKADGWKRAEILTGMAMKGAAIAAGGVLAGQALAFAAPVLGAVNGVTSALGVPLWAIGAAGLSGVASKKLNQLTGGTSSSYVNAGRGEVVRPGAGAAVPQGTVQNAGKPGVAGPQTGGRSGKPGSAQMTEGEAAARERLEDARGKHGRAQHDRREAKKEFDAAQKKVNGSEKKLDELIAGTSNDALKSRRAEVVNAQAAYDSAVKKHGADSEEAKAAKAHLDDRQKAFNEEVKSCGNDQIKQQKAKLDEEKAERDEKKGAFDIAADQEKKAKGEMTKAKKEVEENMSPERKTERAQKIANTIIGGLGAAGTIAATIAGGPVLGFLVHKTTKNVKKASAGVIQSAGSKFGQLKAASGWEKAALISGMVMKGTAAVAGGLAIGSILSTAAPVLGPALTAVNGLTSQLGAPLWALGAVGLTGLASKKLGAARDNGTSYVNTGAARVTRTGAGSGVSPQTATVTASGKPGTKAVPPMTEAEVSARKELDATTAAHSDAVSARKKAQSNLRKLKKKGSGATSEQIQEAETALAKAQEDEGKAKEAKTKAKGAVEQAMSPERKAARREQIVSTFMSGAGALGTVAGTIFGGPVMGLIMHSTAKRLKRAAPGVVNAVSQQFGEFKKADGWRRAEMITGMVMKGAALTAGGIAAGQALSFAAPVLGPALSAVNGLTSKLGAPLWALGTLGVAKLASDRFANARSTGSSYIRNSNAQYVRTGAGYEVQNIPSARSAPYSAADEEALMSARTEFADGLTVANGPRVVYIPQRMPSLRLSSSAVAARRRARGQADGMNIDARRSSATIARDRYNLDKINDTAVVADRNAALANVVRNQTNTKVGMQIAARSIARYGGEGDSIGAQIYAGINGTEKQPGLLTPEMKEQLVLAVLSKVQVERYKNMGEADRQKMIDSYKVVGGMKANGEIGFEVTGRDGSRFADRDVTADVLGQMLSSGKISDANINLSTQELGVGAAVEAQLARNLALGVDYSSDLSRTTNLTDSNVYRTVMNSRKYDDVVSEGILRYVTADPNSDLYATVSKDLGIGDPSELDNPATRERVIEQISRMRRSEGINSINSIQESEYSGQVADVMRERAISGEFNVTAWDYASAATRASEVANIEALKGGVVREDLAAAETRLSRKAVQDNEQMVLLNTFATARIDNKSTIVNDMLNSGKFANITASDDQLLRGIVDGISADDDSETATRVRTAGLDELKLAMKKAIMLRDIGSDRAGLNAEMLAKYLKGGDDIDTALIQEMARRGMGNGSVQSAVGVLQTSLTSGQRTSLLDSAARQGTLGLTVGENRNLRKLVKGTDIDVEKLSYFEASALLHKKSPEDIAKFIELEASRDQAIARLVAAQGGLISNDAVRAELVKGGENGATAALFAGNYSGKMQMLTEVDQEQIKRAAAMAEIDRYNGENPDSAVEYAEHSSLADLAKAVQGNAGLAARIDIAGIDAVDAENRQRLALGMGERIKMYAADIQADPSLYNKARSAFRTSNPGKDLDEVDSMTRNNYLANEFIKSLSQNDRNLVKSRRDAIDLDYITKMTGISKEEAKALVKEAAQAGLSIDSMMLAKGLITPVDALSVDTRIMGNIDGREFTELYNEARRENYEEELYGVGRVKYNIMKNSPNATPAVDVEAMNAEQRSRYEFTRNFLQQMSRTGENPNMLANTFRNTTLYDNDRVVEEMAAIHIDGQEDIDPSLSVAEKKKRLSNEQINAYLSAHEEYRDILTSYAAADITRTLDPASKEKSLYDLATRNPELDARVRAELRSTGKDPASGNKAEYNQALAALMKRDEAFKNAMYSKLTDTFDPGARLSHAERVAFFENSRTIAQGPQGNTMRSISEWLSRYIASEGQDTGNIVLTKKVTLPETSAAYDNWNKYLDSRIAEIKAKKGDYAQMSADERKAEIAKLEAKKIVDNGDTSEEHVKQQEKNKRDAFAVGDFTELYSKGARVDVIHSKAVRAVIAKNGMSSNGEFDVLTGKRITTDVEDRHRLEYAEAQNLRARYRAAAAMRTSRDFGENFSAMATSYLGKKEAVAAAREARNAFLAKFQGTASKTGAPVTATTKYEDLTPAQQKYLRDMRKAALEQRISSRVINASRNVRYDREMRQFDSWTQSQGLVPEIVRYTDGSKRFTQQTSKTTGTGAVDPKTAARRRADQLEYLATRDDRQNVTTFNASYRGSAAQYASEIRKQVFGTSAQKAIEELIASRDPISGKKFSEQALSVQKSKIEKALQDLYSRAESRVNASYKYIPSTARPYIGSSFSLAAGARERELQKSKLSDFRSAFASLSEHRATASFDALYSSLSASIKNSFMNSMSSKERAAFKSQGEAEKFAKLEQYIARNYASLSKHVKVNNFYHTNTSALTDLSGVSVQRSVSSAETRAMMRSLRPSETVRYNDILTRHEVAIRNVHAEEANYRRLAEKFATAGPKEREVIRKQMTDSATRLTTYEKTVKLIEEEKRSFEQRIETRRSAGDIIRTAAGLGSNKNENVLNNYNMRTKGPHGRPIHPGGPLDRPMNMILLRFMERYKNQIQNMYKTEIYQQSQAVMSYTRGKVNKLSNDIARTIADNRQLRKFLKSEISKLDNSIKSTDVALRDAMSNDIARLEEAENEMKVRLSSLEIDLSSMEKKVGKATPPAAKPTTKK